MTRAALEKTISDAVLEFTGGKPATVNVEIGGTQILFTATPKPEPAEK
jgi:hypothetical protein